MTKLLIIFNNLLVSTSAGKSEVWGSFGRGSCGRRPGTRAILRHEQTNTLQYNWAIYITSENPAVMY